jgi:hypothetical protein
MPNHKVAHTLSDDDDDDILLVCCCWPIGVLAVVVVALLRFSVLLVSFDGAAIDGEYDCYE